MGANLFTLAEYKTYAGINSTTQDAQITNLIPKVSQLIKTLCRRSFVDYVDEAKVEVMSGGWGPKLLLKETPLISVGGVEFSEDYGKTYTDLVEFTDYAVNLEDDSITSIGYTVLGRLYEFPKIINGYRVTYNAGYTELPVDLKLAIFDLVTYYLRHDTAVHSSRTVGSNNIQIEYITNVALPAHIMRVLHQYTASFD